MCTPTAQCYHSQQRADDAGIGASDRLLRHCRAPAQIVPLKQSGETVGLKISDQAFKAKKGEPGLSVDLECLLLADGKTWHHRYGLMPNTYAMVAVTAEQARAHSAGVAWTPKPEEPELEGFAALENRYHGEIILPMTNAQVRALFALMEVVRSDVEKLT